MKTAVLTILYTCVAFCVSAQFKNDLQRQKLKGKVKTVTELEYNGTHDSLRYKSVTRFGEDGNAVEFFTYGPSGEVTSKTTFKYDDSGKIVCSNTNP